MHTKVALAVVVTLLSLGLPIGADAQDRKGFWIGTDIGPRASGARFDGFDFERWNWLGIDVDLGWTLKPQVLVGIEPGGLSIFLISGNGDRADSAIVDLLGTLTYYPRRSSGFFIKGGLGPSIIYQTNDEQSIDVSGTGLAVGAGTGYDFYLGRNFSLTTGVNVRFGHIGEIRFDDQPAFRDWRHNTVEFAVGIKFN